MGSRTTEGVLLKVDKTGAGTTFTTLSEVTSIDGPNSTVTALDKTVLADNVRKFRPGLADPGEISIELYFDPNNTEHIWLDSKLSDRSTNTYQIVFPVDGEDPAQIYEFSGFLTSFGFSSGGVDDFITGSATIKLADRGTWEEVA